MPERTPTPSSISPTAVDLGHLLSDYFYEVPAYQREYAWEAGDHVDRLLDDLFEHVASYPEPQGPHYFLGSMVAWGGNDCTQVIDGQQRLTTLWMLTCALRDELREQGESEYAAQYVSPLVMSDRDDGRGNFSQVCRIRFQSDVSNSAIVALERDGGAKFDSQGDCAAQRMIEAYRECRQRLGAEFGNDTAKARAFFSFLRNRVDVVFVLAPGEETALQVFWTMNARGEDLDALDLAKTILMTGAGSEHYLAISRGFKDLRNRLENREKPVDAAAFLVYAVRASCSTTSEADWDRTRPDRIHKWLEEKKRTMRWLDSQRCWRVGISEPGNALAYLEMLQDMAVAYVRFYYEYKYRSGEAVSPVLLDFKHLGRAYRQHLVPLLASRFLPDSEFDRIADSLEDVLFVVKFTGSITRDVEKKLVEWADAIRMLDPTSPQLSDEVARCIEGTMGAYLASKCASFTERFLNPNMGRTMATKQLRYTYAKMAQWVDLRARETRGNRISSEERALTLWWRRGDVEHILPEGWQRMPDWETTFGAHGQEIAQYLYAAGNMTWLERDKNRAIKNRYFCEKQPYYAESVYYMARDLGAAALAGGSPDARRASAVLGQRTWYHADEKGLVLRKNRARRTLEKVWTADEVAERSEALLKVALRVWGMAPPSAAFAPSAH